MGYRKEQIMIFSCLVSEADVDTWINEIFEGHPDIEYLHEEMQWPVGLFV